MAVDPKELILNNKALAVTYLIALAPIGAWFVMVDGGVKGDRGKRDSYVGKVTQLNQKKGLIRQYIDRIPEPPEGQEPVYTQGHVEFFEKKAAMLQQQVDGLTKLIVDRDRALEQWFKDSKFEGLGAKETPDPAEFVTYWKSRAIPTLVEKFKDLITPEGDTGAPMIYDRAPSKSELRQAQKRYWIQNAVLTAIQEGTKDSSPAFPPRMTQACQFTESEERRADGAPKLYDVIGVRCKFRCSFRCLPLVVQQLLSQDVSMQIVELEVEKAPFQIQDPKINLRVDGADKVFLDDYYDGELADHKAFDSNRDYLPEPSVDVSLALEVLDFVLEVAEKPADEGQGEGEGGN